MKRVSLILMMFFCGSTAIAQDSSLTSFTSEVRVASNDVLPINSSTRLTASSKERPHPNVVKGPTRCIYYPSQMRAQDFHKMIDSMGIVVATTNKDGELMVVTPVTITTFPSQRGFVLEVVKDDPRTKVELQPVHTGYEQSKWILCQHDIEVTGPIYHLYPKRVECMMTDLCRKKYSHDTFWRPTLRCRNVINVSYGFYRPCLLSNRWGIYVKSLAYR